MSRANLDDNRGYYEEAVVCGNGHVVSCLATNRPEEKASHCSRCGEATISACPACKSAIRGFYQKTTKIPMIPRKWGPPSHCHACGKPYPWTELKTKALAEVIVELEGLDDTERENLTKSIPDILAETPKSDIAVLRYKKAIAKAGKVAGKALYDLVVNVAGSAIAQRFMNGT
ncbi:MAG: DUF2321 domain-containing protein [Phycisphaeraceae bacterium]